MNVKVELIYDDASKNRKVDIEAKGKGQRLMDSIDEAVAKKFNDDKDWVRWNLISID